jgi:hypothetical protein
VEVLVPTGNYRARARLAVWIEIPPGQLHRPGTSVRLEQGDPNDRRSSCSNQGRPCYPTFVVYPRWTEHHRLAEVDPKRSCSCRRPSRQASRKVEMSGYDVEKDSGSRQWVHHGRGMCRADHSMTGITGKS